MGSITAVYPRTVHTTPTTITPLHAPTKPPTVPSMALSARNWAAM